MRRVFVLLAVALFGIGSPATLAVVAGQGNENEAWQNVEIGPAPSEEDLSRFLVGAPEEGLAPPLGGLVERLHGYQLTFTIPEDPDASRPFVPEIEDAEFMFVHIVSGEFALDVIGDIPFIVDTQDESGIIYLDVNDVGTETEYTLSDPPRPVLDERGEPCNEMCTVAPAPPDEPRVAVQVTDGDWIIAPADAFCAWCMLNKHSHQSEREGSLLVFPLLRDPTDPDSFSWVQSRNAAPSLDTVPASAGGERTKWAWAYFSPPTKCI
jgi:hypothetical protein